MATPAVIALDDQVRVHLARGAFRHLGPIDLPLGGLLEAKSAAQIVLADVEHRDWEERAGIEVTPRVWSGLATQLQFLEHVALFGPGRAGAGSTGS